MIHRAVHVEVGVRDAFEGNGRLAVAWIAVLDLPAQVMVTLRHAIEAHLQVVARSRVVHRQAEPGGRRLSRGVSSGMAT
jgi:hypothetical protein